MSKKLIYLISFVLMLVLAANASAAIRNWDGEGGANNLWNVAVNWDPNIVPTIADIAYIDINDANCLIDATVTAAKCDYLYLGHTDGQWPCYLNMTGGSLEIFNELHLGENAGPCYLNMTGGDITVYYVYVGENSDGNGIFILSNSTVNIEGNLWIALGQNPPQTGDANGMLIMTDGQLDIGAKIYLGKNTTGNGLIYMDGGTINIGDDVEIATYGKGTFVLVDGDVNISDTLKMCEYGTSDPNNNGTSLIEMLGGTIVADELRMNSSDEAGKHSNGTSTINLFGGTITVGDINLRMGGVKPVIDIIEGTLIVEADEWLDDIYQYVKDEWIIAYGGLGQVEVVFAGGVTTITGGMRDPNLAWDPDPENYDTIGWLPAGPTLTWKPGLYAASHDVYFGTDRGDVNDANNTLGLWPEFMGNQPVTYHSTGPLNINTTYYWRIDEVNNNSWAPPGSPWKGPIWQFRIPNYVIVDNMEDYSSTAPDTINYFWRDGWDVNLAVQGNLTGSQTGHHTQTQTRVSESGIVHGGGWSMPYYYENDGVTKYKPFPNATNPDALKFYSEAVAKTTGSYSLGSIDQDWTVQNVKSLSLWFYGDSDNSTKNAQMYVALEDGDIPSHLKVVNYSGDMNDIKEEKWHEWNIKLSSFEDVNPALNVNLANVQKIYIGFGNRVAPLKGDSCNSPPWFQVFFDDIRLYPRRCMPALNPPPDSDLDGDCDVDYDDLNVMAGDWLDSDYTGVGHDGELMNFPTDDSQWDPCHGGSLLFDGINDWVNLDDSEFSNFQDKTIALWVNIKSFPGSQPYIFSFHNDDTETSYNILFRTHDPNEVRVNFVASEDYTEDFNEVYPNTWHHLAFVLRNTGSDTCTGEFYGDGNLIDQLANQPRHSGGATSVSLGSAGEGTGPFVKAWMDDFRVYDAALSANNIKFLAGKPGGVNPDPANPMLLHYKFDETSGQIAANSSTYVFNRPLLSPAELYKGEAVGSRKVNFRDFAILANEWLEEELWP